MRTPVSTNFIYVIQYISAGGWVDGATYVAEDRNQAYQDIGEMEKNSARRLIRRTTTVHEDVVLP